MERKDKDRCHSIYPFGCSQRFLLIPILDMITYLIMRQDMNRTTAKKTKSNLTWSISTRLRKVVYRTKHLTLLLLALVSGKSLFMCHVSASSALLGGKTLLYITVSEMRLRKRLQRESMLIFNVPIQEITDLPKVMFEDKVTKLC